MTTNNQSFPGNVFQTLPARLPPDFRPQSIRHFILTTKERDDDEADPEEGKLTDGEKPPEQKDKWLRFYITEPKQEPPQPALVKEAGQALDLVRRYAEYVASEHLEMAEKEPKSPYDIEIKEQCWIVLELSASLKNWQFTNGEPAITTKENYYDSNCWLVHVSGRGEGEPGAPNQFEGCRVVYFAVVRRGTPANTPDGAQDVPTNQYLNLHVEFLQKHKDETKVRRLKVIFDPDVGNNGEFPIP